MSLPSKTDVEAVLFRHRLWNRGRLLEAAFGLLLGASRSQAHSRTGVAYATIAKIHTALKAEFDLNTPEARRASGMPPLKLTELQRTFLNRAIAKTGKATQEWMRSTLLAAASTELREAQPSDLNDGIDGSVLI